VIGASQNTNRNSGGGGGTGASSEAVQALVSVSSSPASSSSSTRTPTGPGGALPTSSWDVSEREGDGDGRRVSEASADSTGRAAAGFDPAAVLFGGTSGDASTTGMSASTTIIVVEGRRRLGFRALLPKPKVLYLFGIPKSTREALPKPGPLPPRVPPVPGRADPSYLNGPPVVVNPQGDLERKPPKGGKERGRDRADVSGAKSDSAGTKSRAGGEGGGAGEGAGAAGNPKAWRPQARVGVVRNNESENVKLSGGDSTVDNNAAAAAVKPAAKASTAARAIAKAESFHLGGATVVALLAKKQDVSLGTGATSAARASAAAAIDAAAAGGAGAAAMAGASGGKISCGGKAIMEFRDMAAVAGVAGIDEALPASDDLVTVGGDVGKNTGTEWERGIVTEIETGIAIGEDLVSLVLERQLSFECSTCIPAVLRLPRVPLCFSPPPPARTNVMATSCYAMRPCRITPLQYGQVVRPWTLAQPGGLGVGAARQGRLLRGPRPPSDAAPSSATAASYSTQSAATRLTPTTPWFASTPRPRAASKNTSAPRRQFACRTWTTWAGTSLRTRL